MKGCGSHPLAFFLCVPSLSNQLLQVYGQEGEPRSPSGLQSSSVWVQTRELEFHHGTANLIIAEISASFRHNAIL